jgi:hypothetical protein
MDEYITCLCCKCKRHKINDFRLVKDRRLKRCMKCEFNHRKREVPEEVPEVPEEVLETKMDWDAIYKTNPINFKQFLEGIHITNIDIHNLIRDYTLDEKVIELIQEEYETLKEKPFYVFHQKKQILLIKARDWVKMEVDADFFELIKEYLVKRILQKAGDKEISLEFNKERFTNALLRPRFE